MIPSSCPPSPRTVAWMRCTAPVSAEIPFPTGNYWDRHREAQRGRVQPCGAPLRSDGSACTSPARHPGPAGKIQLYATATNTRRNLDAMHRQGCRVLMGPDQLSRWPADPPPLAWALDNGAYGCWKAGRPFDAEAFAATVARWGDGADWIVAPDIVAGGLASLDLSLAWLPRLLPIAPVLIAVQDGMEPADVAPHLSGRVGIFVGGSTEWKWRSLPSWAALAARVACRLHVGRVNSAKAIRLCASLGVASCDGTSLSRYSINAERLGAATRAPVQIPLR